MSGLPSTHYGEYHKGTMEDGDQKKRNLVNNAD